MSPKPIVPITKNYPTTTGSKWARTLFWLLTLLTFNLSLIISNCGLDIEDPTPPSRPVWVQKSLPEEWPERGIDAHESGGIYLEWEPDDEDQIVAYQIYRAQLFEANDSLSNYNLIVHLETESTPTLDYVDNHVSNQLTYVYRIKARSASGDLSEYSDPISFSLIESISSHEMTPNGSMSQLGNNRHLYWGYDYAIQMENYIITILTANDELILRQVLIPSSYIGGRESFNIPANISLQSNMNYKWRVDVGANYRLGRETRASESNWATFLNIEMENLVNTSSF